MQPQVPRTLDTMPQNSPLIEARSRFGNVSSNISDDNTEETNIVTYMWQQFFGDIAGNIRSFLRSSTPGFLLNSNFNILSTNGTTPVTPAEGSDYEVIKQWFVVNGGGGNSYTLTPTLLSDIPFYGAGSNYKLNVNASVIATDLYLYNLNYSQTSAFNSISKFSGVPVTFSFMANNNTDATQFIKFSAALSGMTFPDGSSEMFTQELALEPGFNVSSKTIQMPDLSGTSYSATDFMQFRTYFTRAEGSGFDVDFYYLKSELGDCPFILDVNPVLEALICQNLV